MSDDYILDFCLVWYLYKKQPIGSPQEYLCKDCLFLFVAMLNMPKAYFDLFMEFLITDFIMVPMTYTYLFPKRVVDKLEKYTRTINS